MEEKVLAKIRKLLAMANDNAAGGEHERDTAMRMALSLLAKHNLTMAGVNHKESAEGRTDLKAEYYDYVWARTMAGAIAKLFFCNLFTMKTGKKDRSTFTFVGLESNVATAKEMYDYILKSVTREASRVTTAAGEGQTFKWSFCKGASATIYARCLKLRAEAEGKGEKAPGTSLVLASLYTRELVANDAYIAERMGIKLTTRHAKTRNTDRSGFAQGQAYGAKVGLGKQLN